MAHQAKTPSGGNGPQLRIGPRRLSRRELFTLISVAGGGVVAAAVAVPVVGYLIGPLLNSSPNQWLDLGAVSDFEVGQTQEASFNDPSSVQWAGETASTAVWVRRSGPEDFTVFAVNCTHLGCPVNWLPQAALFLCPCHGGVYNADGTVAGGPPPRSLFTYQTRIRSGRLQALTRPLPTD